MVLKANLRKSEVGLIGLGIELQDPLNDVDQDGRLGFHFVGQLKLPEMGFRVARRVMYYPARKFRMLLHTNPSASEGSASEPALASWKICEI